jgi:hypothetical protein
MGTRASEVKQPDEIVLKGIDFTGSDRLADGDDIKLEGSSVKITDQDGTDVTSEMLVPNSLAVSVTDKTILAFIKEGTSGIEYKVTFLTATELGELLEEDIILPVEDL